MGCCIVKSLAQAFANERAKVVIADINIAGATTTAQEIGFTALAVKMNVTQQDSIDQTVNTAVDQLS